MRQKILLTGGAGYIGSHTAVALQKAGYEPIVVDSLVNSDERIVKGITTITGAPTLFYKVDCCDASALDAVFKQESPIAGVIHFAAFKAVDESVKDPAKYYQNNLGSLLALLSVMRKYAVSTIVFSSSCTVYGKADELPITEKAPLKPATSPYGQTKQMCETILRDAYVAGQVGAVSLLRYFNPIGAHSTATIGELQLNAPSNLVPIITQVAAGIREKLMVYGSDYATPDGSCIRDYIHVMDLAEAHIASLRALLAGKRQLGVYNIGTGTGLSVFELINRFEKVTGQHVHRQVGERRAGDVPVVYAEPHKAEEELGWKATRTIEDALASAWKWQQALL